MKSPATGQCGPCSFRRLPSLSAADMESVTRKVNVKNRGATVSAFAREHYLRQDLPCRSELCFENCGDFKDGVMLPKDVTHYLVRVYETFPSKI